MKNMEQRLDAMGFNKPKSIRISPHKWRQLVGGRFAKEKPLIRDCCNGLI